MTMRALISGSIAFDTIMVFKDRFGNHLLPDQVHILNVSFLVDNLRREFGGCAGNIAYTLNLLGDEALPVAAVGRDFQAYAAWLQTCGIPTTHLLHHADSYTAQAYITTDLDDNQITAFHPGAMSFAHLGKIPTDAGADIGIVAPNGKQAMLEHCRQFAEAGIPFVFDPGQGLPMFDAEELANMVALSSWVSVNDYESRLMAERMQLSVEAIAERVQGLIVTRGSQGSVIHSAGRRIDIPPVPAEAVLDPTGCGDAYRAGLLYGLARGLDWEVTGRIASVLGAIKVATHGTQNHHLTLEGVRQRYREAYGSEPVL